MKPYNTTLSTSSGVIDIEVQGYDQGYGKRIVLTGETCSGKYTLVAYRKVREWSKNDVRFTDKDGRFGSYLYGALKNGPTHKAFIEVMEDLFESDELAHMRDHLTRRTYEQYIAKLKLDIEQKEAELKALPQTIEKMQGWVDKYKAKRDVLPPAVNEEDAA